MGLTSRIGSAPKDDGAVFVLLGTEDLMKLKGEPVQVTDVEWAKVMVEVVVEQGVVDGEVIGLLVGWLLHCLWAMAGPLRPLCGGADRRLGIREEGILIRCVYV